MQSVSFYVHGGVFPDKEKLIPHKEKLIPHLGLVSPNEE